MPPDGRGHHQLDLGAWTSLPPCILPGNVKLAVLFNLIPTATGSSDCRNATARERCRSVIAMRNGHAGAFYPRRDVLHTCAPRVSTTIIISVTINVYGGAGAENFMLYAKTSLCLMTLS